MPTLPFLPPPQDTLRDCDQESTCYNTVISPIYFVSFVLTAQFVLVNVVIAVLMKHLEESNKEAKEEAELEAELELEMKTLSPQPRSPLGSPFLWPGVEGPDSPDSPKPGTSPAAPRARVASRFSLEHPTVSRCPTLFHLGTGVDRVTLWGRGHVPDAPEPTPLANTALRAKAVLCFLPISSCSDPTALPSLPLTCLVHLSFLFPDLLFVLPSACGSCHLLSPICPSSHVCTCVCVCLYNLLFSHASRHSLPSHFPSLTPSETTGL